MGCSIDVELDQDGIDYFAVVRGFERLLVRRALRLTPNRERAARLLGLRRSTLLSIMRRLEVEMRTTVLGVLVLLAVLVLAGTASAQTMNEKVSACTRNHASCNEVAKEAQKDVIRACSDLSCRTHAIADLVALNMECLKGWRDCYRAAHGLKPLR